MRGFSFSNHLITSGAEQGRCYPHHNNTTLLNRPVRGHLTSDVLLGIPAAARFFRIHSPQRLRFFTDSRILEMVGPSRIETRCFTCLHQTPWRPDHDFKRILHTDHCFSNMLLNISVLANLATNSNTLLKLTRWILMYRRQLKHLKYFHSVCNDKMTCSGL